MSSTPPPKSGHGEEDAAASGASATTKPVKTEAADDGSLLNIKVNSQTAPDAFFRIKRSVKLRRLMDLYCGKHSLDPRAVVFLDPEGKHILSGQTPDDVGLQDGDEISIMIHQTAGSATRAGIR
ncbi:hypothetical protein ACP70R_038660 [Stipagrostis hirtigluma subsp. patula]